MKLRLDEGASKPGIIPIALARKTNSAKVAVKGKYCRAFSSPITSFAIKITPPKKASKTFWIVPGTTCILEVASFAKITAIIATSTTWNAMIKS